MDNLIIVSAFVYFSHRLTDRLVIYCTNSYSQANTNFVTMAYCVFNAIKFAHFVHTLLVSFFHFCSGHVTASNDSTFVYGWKKIKMKQKLQQLTRLQLTGWANRFIFQHLRFSPFGFELRVKIYWATRVYNVKMAQAIHELLFFFVIFNNTLQLGTSTVSGDYERSCSNLAIESSIGWIRGQVWQLNY